MKKIGLCVRYDTNNYGSMLQILATQKIIENMDYDYEFIRYNKKTVWFMIKNIPRLFNPYYMRGIKMRYIKKKKLHSYPDIEKLNQQRLDIFSQYRKTYFHKYSPVYKGYSNLVKGASSYDTVLVGSDQLWTPAGITSKFYNLLFVPDNVNKVSYATSFGVGQIPKNQSAMTTKYLKRINHISVREIRGSQIVEELTGRKVLVALDPTLLLTGEEWLQVFPNKTKSNEPYIFCYFLGKNPKHRKISLELQKRLGVKIITTPHLDEFVEGDLHFGDEKRFDIGPEDFLNLIRNAEYVCTDSFHGTVFSILNHKKFVTFNRFDDGEKQSRNSRIDTLFELLGLQQRRYKENILETISSDIDYNSVEIKLSVLRKDSLEYLRQALKNSSNT